MSKNYFGIPKKIVNAIHNVMLFSMLHSSFIAPVQDIVVTYLNHQPTLKYKASRMPITEAKEKTPAFCNEPNVNLCAVQTSNDPIAEKISKPLSNYIFPADLMEGRIGVSNEFPLDDPSDNLFKIRIDALPSGSEKIILSYDVFGVSDQNGVSKSINNRLATGGHMVKKQKGWSIQTEELDPSWLKEGENMIMFTTPKGADHTYKIKNLKIQVKKDDTGNEATRIILQNKNISIRKDNKIYIKGFIKKTDGSNIKVIAGETLLSQYSNEFEGFVDLSKEDLVKNFVAIRAYEGNNMIGQEIIDLGIFNEADKFYPIEKEFASKYFDIKAFETSKHTMDGATIEITDSSMVSDKTISITPLRKIDIAPMESGMINVTKGGKAFRFLPDGTKFNKAVKITLEYDTILLPDGYSPKDIKTFYFDTHSKQWTAIKTDTINLKNNTVTSLTTHFTDYVNGIIQAPESPQTGAFMPNMMNDIKMADPSAEMTLISPPQASQKGDANISYPIKIPAGRRGMQPQIALQYSNEGGNGWVGQGWNLNLPAISIDTRWGVPLFDPNKETEIYTLSGEQLIYPKTEGEAEEYMPNRHQITNEVITTVMQPRNTSGTKIFSFRKKGNFAKIERLGTSPTNYYWKVTTTDGTINWYGGTEEGIISSAVLKNSLNQIAHWALVRTIDVYGNNVNYDYTIITNASPSSNLFHGKQQYINNIYYTGTGNTNGNYQIQFYRNPGRSDNNINARLGFKQTESQLLEYIFVKYQGNDIRSYKLNYKTGRFSKSLLEWIAEYDKSGNEFYRHNFEYYDDIALPNNGGDVYYSEGVEQTICDAVPEIPGEEGGGNGEDVCVEVYFKIPLQNVRHEYTILAVGGNNNTSIPNYCYYNPFRLKNINLNGVTYTPPGENLFFNHYNSGFQNMCPSYVVTAITPNLDTVTQNPSFVSLASSWLQNTVLAGPGILDANSNLTVTNTSGLSVAQTGYLSNHAGFKATFISSANFTSGSCSWNSYDVANNAHNPESTFPIYKQLHSANGIATNIYVNGNLLEGSPFNIYENPEAFETAFENAYGGEVEYEYSSENYNWSSNYSAYIRVQNSTIPVNSILIGSSSYQFKKCETKGERFQQDFITEASIKDSTENNDQKSNPNLENLIVEKKENTNLTKSATQASLPNSSKNYKNYFHQLHEKTNNENANDIQYCETLINDEYLIETDAPTFNSMASLLGSSKTEGNGLGFYLGIGIGCRWFTKNTTFGLQYNVSQDKSKSFTALIDINGDGLEDIVLKQSNTLFWSKHIVTHTYDANNELSISHSFEPYKIITGINDFYNAKSESSTLNFQVTFGFSSFGGFVGKDKSKTKSETSVYFTDGNGDGLPDIVKNGVVYFNRIDESGNPKFIPDSQGSPNLVITASPKEIEVPEEYDDFTLETPNYDVVKVWEAPYTGFIRMNNDIQLTDLSQEVTVTIEMTHKEISYLIFGAVLNASNPTISHTSILGTDIDGMSGLGNGYSNYRLAQGQKLYFRVHSKNGSNPKVDWDPEIEYTSLSLEYYGGPSTDLAAVDQNQLSPYKSNYSDGFLLSSEQSTSQFPGSGFANIQWNDVLVYFPSDTVKYEIYKRTVSTNNANLEDSTISNDQLIYSKTCPAWESTTVSVSNNEIYGINLAAIEGTSTQDPALPNTISTEFYLKVSSDSNIDWKQNDWKPKITYNVQDAIIGENGVEDQINTETIVYPVPDISAYKVYNLGHVGTPTETYRGYNSINLLNLPVESGTNILEILPTLEEIFSDSDNGEFNFIVKKSGRVIGKRHITVVSGNITLDNLAPIALGIKNNEIIEIGFYSDDTDLIESDNVSILKKIYSSIYALARISYPSSLYDTYDIYNFEVNFMHRVNQKFGTMYRQWGQFLYNPNAVQDAKVSEYGNLIKESALNTDINATELQNATDYLEGLGQDITEEQLTDFEENNQNLWADLAMLTPSPVRKIDSDYNYIERWYGINEENYASETSFRAANLMEGLSTLDYYEDETVQDVLQTGAIAVTKYSTGGSKNIAAGGSVSVTPTISVGASGTKSLDGSGDALTDYIDLNGDRYPDLVSKNKVQYTTRTGGLYGAVDSKSKLNGDNGGLINQSSNESWGVSASGSYSQGGKGSNSTDGTGNEKPRFIGFKGTNGAGISGNFSKGESEANRMWADINGDGLADILERNAQGIVDIKLNLGTNYHNSDNVSSSWGLNDIFNSNSRNFSGGIGINKWNGSFEAGISLGVGKNDTEFTLTDINGDGLADIINSSSSGINVRINKGNAFEPLQQWSDFNLDNESEIQNASLNFGATASVIIPIPFISICLKISASANGTAYSTSTNKTKKSITDFDGDGFPDLIEEISSGTIIVKSSTIRRTNMLKSVTNPLGGKFTIDYQVKTSTYENPHPKWVMTEVLVEDGYDLANDGIDKYRKQFKYENAKYDRREREFYGFETVKTEDRLVDGQLQPSDLYRTSITKFHNNSYFLNGLVKESYTINGGNENQIYAKTINTYEIKSLDAQGYINVQSASLPLTYDVGGSEGRRSAAVLLTKTQNLIYELGQTPLTKENQMVYDKYGRVVRYSDLGNINNPDDDYSSVISYNDNASLLAKNILTVPSEILVYDNGNVLKRKRVTAGIDFATGAVGKITAMISGSDSATTKMEYDEFGNLSIITYPENSNGESMYYKYIYDATENKYVEAISDAFGYTSYSTYRPDFDALIETKDLAGNLMTYTYDNFGRNIEILAPKEIESGDKYTIQFSYYPFYSDLQPISCIDPENFVPFAITKHIDKQNKYNDIETYTFIDGLARPVQVKKDIQLNKGSLENPEFVEAMSVSGKVEYDEFGRGVKQYHPYYEEKKCEQNQLINKYESPYYSQTVFDPIDRPTKTIDPEQSISTLEYTLDQDVYGNLAMKTESSVEQNSQQLIFTQSFKDVNGRVTSTMNQGPTDEIWTKFAYNSIGELLSYKDAEDITTTYSYDNLGRKTAVNHPDNGTTTFYYDKASNLMKLQTANLLADSSLDPADQFIKYEYEYNRVKNVIYPPTPSGTNIANVIYKYGDSGNDTGRLTYQQDATGIQMFTYGNMGEITTNTRTVVGPNIPTRTFVTNFSYDSWNRLEQMRYPDNEKVIYRYDLGGNLFSIEGEFNGASYEYLKRIHYDYYEQREYVLYGNDTDMTYKYTPSLRRLENMLARTSSQENMFDNAYRYDKIGNVTHISNSAGTNSTNQMGGAYNHYFKYDSLNRLTNGEGNFEGNPSQAEQGNDASSDYTVNLTYNLTHGITNKEQNHSRNGNVFEPNTYKNEYKYIENKHQISTILNGGTGIVESFKHDGNGNIVNRNVSDGTNKDYFWDESNRLRATTDQNNMQHYIYDASGERILKASSDMVQLYENGTAVDQSGVVFNTYKTYPSAFIVVDGNGQYSKHYYAGSQRIVSRIGDQSSDIFNARTAGENGFEPEKLRQQQITDIQGYAELAKKGKVTFKEYKTKETKETDEKTGEARAPQGNIYFFHPDHLGTATYLTDINGNPYQFFLNLPFGETMAEQHSFSENYTNPYKFNGKELDTETGLYYYGARYYDPRISVWLSVDPMAEQHPDNNTYIYCMNNPLRYIDPDGKDYILAVLARDLKTCKASKVEVRATVYITGSNASAARAKELNAHAKSVYKSRQIDGAEVSFNINYVYKEKITEKLKPGENVLNFNNKKTTSDDRSHVKGRQRRIDMGKFIFFTGNSGEIYANGDNQTVMHETGHFLGLPDRYEDINTVGTGSVSDTYVHPGFEDDLMGNSNSKNINKLYYSQYLEKSNSDEADIMKCYLQIGIDIKGNIITPYEEGGKHVESPYKKNN